MTPEDNLNRSLFEICRAMVSQLDLRDVLDTIIHLSTETLFADSGSILLYDPESEHLEMIASKGLPPDVVARGYLPRHGSITERIVETDEPAIVGGPDTTEGMEGIEHSDDRIHSALCAPLRTKGELIGTINLNRYSADKGHFTHGDLSPFMILASQAAVCIHNARLYEDNLTKTRMATIGQTVAGLSHCIKNLLTGLRGGLGLVEMAQDAHNWEASARGVRLLRRYVERVSLLAFDMLDYSSEKVPVRTHTSIHGMAEEVFNVVRLSGENPRVDLSVEVDEDCQTVWVDSGQMFRCLLNLVENAVDAVGEAEGHVRIRCVRLTGDELAGALGRPREGEDRGFRLSVEDDGQGIDPHFQRTIFEPFFSTKASRGTGLGLAVTRKIVREHGGLVTVASKPGEGTTFHVVIPESPATSSERETAV